MGTLKNLLIFSFCLILSQGSTIPPITERIENQTNAQKKINTLTTVEMFTSTTSVKPLSKTTIPIEVTVSSTEITDHKLNTVTISSISSKKPQITTAFETKETKTTESSNLPTTSSLSSTTAAEISTSTAVPSTTTVNIVSSTVVQQNVSTTTPTSGLKKTTDLPSEEHVYPARVQSRLDERLQALDCDIPLLPAESRLWRGNETHELTLPIKIPEECPSGSSSAGGGEEECLPMVLSWEGAAEVQSGDILLVSIDDSQLTLVNTPTNRSSKTEEDRMHHAPMTAVYQVTRQGHEHCDVTEGVLLDITPLLVDGKKLVTLYDKDLTEGVNLLIVVSENWGSQCVRLKVTVKSDNCGDNQDCSEKGVCYSNISMEGYECQCCPGFVGPHCEEQDACFPSPCTNNGICVDISQGHDGTTYQCLCPYGYTGKNCQEEVDPCSSSPCQNGATCSGNVTQFRCDCPRGFSGLLCQHAMNECESSPCVHGICVDQDDGYRCFCQPGFAGQHCEYEYNECESSPCLNGGTCTDHIGAYMCTCGRGFTGKRCHIKVDLCSPSPCSLHHYCVDRGNNYSCECPKGYAGPDCLMPAVATCTTNPCANGGTCWSSVDSFYCACRPGFTGKTCEEDFIVESVGVAQSDLPDVDNGDSSVREVRLPIALYHDRLHNAYIAAGTLGAAMAIVGVVVTVCHCRVNKTYQRWLSRVHPGRRGCNITSAGPPHHWLSDKQAPLPPVNPRPLPPLESADMYYTLDFTDSQSSPLIQ